MIKISLIAAELGCGVPLTGDDEELLCSRANAIHELRILGKDIVIIRSVDEEHRVFGIPHAVDGFFAVKSEPELLFVLIFKHIEQWPRGQVSKELNHMREFIAYRSKSAVGYDGFDIRKLFIRKQASGRTAH